MTSFLRENWPYIVIPFVLALIGVAVLIFLSQGESGAVFVYDVF